MERAGQPEALVETEEEKRLRKIYYDPSHPAALGSVAALAAAANVPVKKTRKWLTKQSTYTLHRQARKTYPSRKYYVNTIDDQWQMDLADMNQLQAKNNNHRYILTCIDILSGTYCGYISSMHMSAICMNYIP